MQCWDSTGQPLDAPVWDGYAALSSGAGFVCALSLAAGSVGRMHCWCPGPQCPAVQLGQLQNSLFYLQSYYAISVGGTTVCGVARCAFIAPPFGCTLLESLHCSVPVVLS